VFFPALRLLLHALNKLPRLSMTVRPVPELLDVKRVLLKPRQVYRGVKLPLGKKYTDQVAVDPVIIWYVHVGAFAARCRPSQHRAGGRSPPRPRVWTC
jgi:hypothetical protein